MKKPRNKRHFPYSLVISLLFCTGAALVVYFHHNHKLRKPLATPIAKKPVLMTVFVHGTFGTMLGLLSLTSVINDKLKGTLYRKINKKMRNDPYFYQDQAISSRGLHHIDPEQTPQISHDKKLAAYPITQAFETIETTVQQKNGKQYFYTFGWSGLISQSKRRLDALRFYNCLIEETNKIKQRDGVTPSIRLIAHSHGGNICLNLAVINEIMLNQTIFFKHEKMSVPNKEQKLAHKIYTLKQEPLSKMFELIKQLPSKSHAKKHRGKLDVDYVPEACLPHIIELILYGSPIQPETEPFFTSSTFNNIYHFYSEQDHIQQLDWISTKKFYSNQRISPYIFEANNNTHKVIQCKVMYDQDLKNSHSPAPEGKTEQKSIWGKVFSTKAIFSKKSKDPSHKELWFFPWLDEKKSDLPYLWPLPTVIFTPLFTSLINNLSTSCDMDLNVINNNKSLIVSIALHNTSTIQHHASLPSHLINTIKKTVKKWKPDNFSEKSSFNNVYKHLIQNKLLN